MTGTATGGLPGGLDGPTAAADLSTLAARIEPAPAVSVATPGDAGRLGELAGWLAAVTGQQPALAPRRARCICIGRVPDALLTLADETGVGVREVGTEPAGAALDRGAGAADAEVDGGADLLVVATGKQAAETCDAAAALIAVLRDLEPVAVLPRGAAAADTAAWIARAERIRTLRRELIGLRSRPAELLDRLADPALTALAGVIAQASARRTPLLLDGAATAAIAYLVERLRPRAASWWQLADTTREPAGARAARELGLTPLLQLDVAAPGGVAGLLAVQLVRAATVLGRETLS